MLKLRKEVYLDNNATTKISKDVIKKMNYVLENVYGNPSSLYKTSHQSSIMLESAREEVAKSINARSEEIIFTGCATESNNTVLKFLFDFYYPRKKRIISTPIEHPATLSTLEYLLGKGAEILFVKLDKFGEIDYNHLRELMNDEVFLVCCMNVNNEIGVINDIKKAAAITHERGALFFSDCVQALGKIKIDVRDSDIDYASFSAHKINGPKGVGALFVKAGNPIGSFMHGGHQENGYRAGTEGLHNIAGFGQACKNINAKLEKSEYIEKLKDRFIYGLKSKYPEILINSIGKRFVSNTISVVFPGTANEKLMAALDYRGVCVSAGSACNTQDNEPSHVLKAIGLSDEQARSTLRFSLSGNNSYGDIDYTLKAIADFYDDKMPAINMFSPKQINETLLFDKSTFILDIRSAGDRRSIKNLPNAFEASFYGIKKYLNEIPKDKLIIVVCQGGVNSPFTAYYLKSKGYRNVGFIMTGMWGWKLANKELHDKYLK